MFLFSIIFKIILFKVAGFVLALGTHPVVHGLTTTSVLRGYARQCLGETYVVLKIEAKLVICKDSTVISLWHKIWNFNFNIYKGDKIQIINGNGIHILCVKVKWQLA